MAPITKAKCPTCPPGPIDPYKSFQTEITATWVILGDKNVPLNPPQTWGKELNVCYEDDEGEDRVDLVEEQYNTAIENGEVIGEYV